MDGTLTSKGKVIHLQAGRLDWLPDTEPLEKRLAECLAAATDRPLLTLRDPCNGGVFEVTLGALNGDIAERAAALLDEAGV